MRIHVEEKHVIKAKDLDDFCNTKEKNGFKVKDVSWYTVAGENRKLVIIEKWNI